MSKREKLNKALDEAEHRLKHTLAGEKCNCDCHEPGVVMLHIVECCSYYGVDVDELQQTIVDLKKKLRK